MTGLDTLVAITAPLEHDPDELRSRAEDLLSRPPYVEHEPGLISRALDWLGDLVARILDSLTVAGGAPVAWATLALGVVLLLLVVWRTTRGMTPDFDRGVSPGVERKRSSTEWFALADGHAEAGRWRDAVRCRYAGLVTALESAGLIDPVPGRTVHELDAEVRVAAPRIAHLVAEAGNRFEAVVFGGAVADGADVEVVDAAAEAVVSEVGGQRRQVEVGA